MSEQLHAPIPEKEDRIEKARKIGVNEDIYFVPFGDKMLSLRSKSNLYRFKQEGNLPGLLELESAVDSQLNILIPKLNQMESDIETKIILGEDVQLLSEKKELAQTQIDTIFKYKEILLPIIKELSEESIGNDPNPLREIFPTFAKWSDKFFGK